jgi:hypothetical protein
MFIILRVFGLLRRKRLAMMKKTKPPPFRHCEDYERSVVGRSNPENNIKTIHNHKQKQLFIFGAISLL